MGSRGSTTLRTDSWGEQMDPRTLNPTAEVWAEAARDNRRNPGYGFTLTPEAQASQDAWLEEHALAVGTRRQTSISPWRSDLSPEEKASLDKLTSWGILTQNEGVRSLRTEGSLLCPCTKGQLQIIHTTGSNQVGYRPSSTSGFLSARSYSLWAIDRVWLKSIPDQGTE